MADEKPKPTLRFILQASVPVADVADGDAFYVLLKQLFQSKSEKCTLNAQLVLMLEPCCGKGHVQHVIVRNLTQA